MISIFYNNISTPPTRHHGAESIIVAIITCVLVSVMGLSLSRLQNSAFLNLSSGNSSLQAQQYAAMESERLRITNYADLTSKSKSKIPNSSYYSEVTVGIESNYNDTIKQKECTINIYKDDDVLPRYTVKVVRMTKENTGNTGVPPGTIIPWYGNLNNIPDGFALCNGQNGTPDLRDRFLVGAGNSYVLGNTGGANIVTLTVVQMPSHAHNRGNMNITGVLNVPNGNAVGYPTYYSASGVFYCNGRATYGGNAGDGGVGGRIYFDASRSWTGVTSYEGGNQPHENRPPYFAVYYLMKL